MLEQTEGLKYYGLEAGETMAKMNPSRDVDSANQCLVLNTFFKIFPFLGILGLLAGGVVGLLAAAAISALAAGWCVGAAEGLGGLSANLLYGTGRHGWSLRDQLEGDLSRLRVHKMNGRLEQALATAEDILDRDPHHPEALILKAQILKEGYGDLKTAKACLKSVLMSGTEQDSAARRWADSLYREWTG
jgi:hypothetical protein